MTAARGRSSLPRAQGSPVSRRIRWIRPLVEATPPRLGRARPACYVCSVSPRSPASSTRESCPGCGRAVTVDRGEVERGGDDQTATPPSADGGSAAVGAVRFMLVAWERAS
jgi:hypothetical protein